jgi:transposase
MIAANLFDQKLKVPQIAKALDVVEQTIRRWRRVYLKGGRDALRLNKHPGRPALLSETDRQKLAELLLRTPAECGFDKYLWTTQLIAELIAREFGITYHNDHVSVILGAMGFTHQKPTRRARERDEAKIEGWRQQTWPALFKKVSSARA